MRFEFWTSPGKSHLKAHFEEGDTVHGKRQEGPGTPIEYKGDDIHFDYEVEDIHPDLLGLICLFIFYPFIGNSVEFAKPVSPRLEEAFRNECFERQFEFRNIDHELKVYNGNRMALSFGGGIDSSAVRTMFPDAYIVHEGHIRNGEIVPCFSHEVVRQVGIDKARVILTNQRYVSHPGGWHGWPCSTITSLLMATDMDFGIIFTGSIIGSTMLSNGNSFWDRLEARKWHGPSGNYWQSTFGHIGLPMFAPVTGVSEFQTMNLSLQLIYSEDVVYCMDDNGAACGFCTKCFRRDLIRSTIEHSHSVNWNNYDNEKIHSLLTKRPLYFGHVFSYAMSRNESLPDWVSSSLKDIPSIQTDWPMKVLTESFDLCPQPWRKIIQNRVLQFISPMTDIEKVELTSWTQIVEE